MRANFLPNTISAAILYYAGTHEDDQDTLENVKSVAESLTRLGHHVVKKVVNNANWQKAVLTPGDIVFNFVEDDFWELYLKVGLILEHLGRAQVGHDLASFKYATQKKLVKNRLKKLDINSPNFRIFNRHSDIKAKVLRFPLIIKPCGQHAGIGISQSSVVTTNGDLEKQVSFLFSRFPGSVMAEEYIAGREIHVTILGNGKDITVLPLCEETFGGKFKKNWSIYTYKAKWDKKSWEYWDARVDSPAKIPSVLTQKIRNLATRAYNAFGLRDIARIDVRIDKNGKPYIVDVNVNPSLNVHDTEDATVASVTANHWTYDYFIKTLVGITYKRVYGIVR